MPGLCHFPAAATSSPMRFAKGQLSADPERRRGRSVMIAFWRVQSVPYRCKRLILVSSRQFDPASACSFCANIIIMGGYRVNDEVRGVHHRLRRPACSNTRALMMSAATPAGQQVSRPRSRTRYQCFRRSSVERGRTNSRKEYCHDTCQLTGTQNRVPHVWHPQSS